VDLGIRVRAKAVALNPNAATHTAAVLTMGATQAVEVFDTRNCPFPAQRGKGILFH
jgi:hypothetical protein